jgi:hypothetical protein
MSKSKVLPVGLVKLLLSIFIVIGLAGCSVTSEKNVIGEYVLQRQGRIELSISPGGSFSETIVWPTGKVSKASGTWEWHDSGISFDQLWIPPEFAPGYIREADQHSEEQPKYTEPGNWSMKPERHWGNVTLPVFPDADISFKMTKHYR